MALPHPYDLENLFQSGYLVTDFVHLAARTAAYTF
jgi:hypothetical protein